MKTALIIPLCLLLIGCTHFALLRQSEIYEFPQGFHGWAVIVWGVPGHPPCRRDHGNIIARFPADGVVLTSTKLDFKAVRDGAYFLDAAEHRLISRPTIGFVGNGFIHDDKSDHDMDYTQVFLGTEAEYFLTTGEAPQVDKLWRAGISSQER